MSRSLEFVYSNDLCSTFLAAIVEAFENYHPNAFLGRTAMQKLAYFAQVGGAPIPCSFGIYTYGPYSDQVTFSVDSLLADDVIIDRSKNSQYSNYRLGQNSDDFFADYGGSIRPYRDLINKVVKALGGFSPAQLELISTLHFIATRHARVRRSVSRRSVIEEFKSIKHDKFEDSEIKRGYDALAGAGLIAS